MAACHKSNCRHFHGYGVCVDCMHHRNIYDRRYDRYEPRELQPRLVFLSHPYRGDPEANLVRCTEFCRRLAEEHPDVVIVSPLHMFSYLSEDNRAIIMDYCRALIERCDEVWLAPGWEQSEGCQLEAKWGREMGKPVKKGDVQSRLFNNNMAVD